MMRIAFVLSHPVPPTAQGGAERWVLEAAQALARHADVTVHYMGPGELETRTPVRARRHQGLRPPRIVPEADRLTVAPGLVGAASGADVVHIHQFGTLTAQAAAVLGRLRRRAVFVTDHGSGGLPLGRRLHLDRLFDGFLEVSAFAATFAPPDKRRLMYGGADPERFRPGERASPAFALYAGRIAPHKGVDWLIESLPEGSRLVVAGRPDEERWPGYLDLLRYTARGKDVSFELNAPDERLAELYRSASVVVLPSVFEDVYGRRHRLPELLGLTLLEGMASGTPVICSRAAGMPDAIDSGVTGLIVEPGEVDGLRAALRALLDDPEAVETMGAAARERALERFTWDAVAARCLKAYSELAPRALPAP
jgi:glycosyltransferase involved in cell wall biosynthesis